MLSVAPRIYNLPSVIYRVRAVWDDAKSPGCAGGPGQLHEIVCTVYEIGVVMPVIDTE
jgi:hypothetical protein